MTISPEVQEFLANRYGDETVSVSPVEGGYSRNRRAIIDIGDTSIFAKEVNTELLPDNGEVELSWLKKDYDVINEFAKRGVAIAPEWAELHMNGRLLLLPSYKKEDGWQWSPPQDKAAQRTYIQSVVSATKQLEGTALPEELTEALSLQPFFRDEVAQYEGIEPLFADPELRVRLIGKYTQLQARGDHLQPTHLRMLDTLKSDEQLRHLQQQSHKLAELPNDYLNHCDVRSDNIAYNEKTGEVKFVDWNWTSYAPAKFGATEFLVDMARRGADVSPWYQDMSPELLAATVGYYTIRSLKPPLSLGSTLREMQTETAAAANYLYWQLLDNDKNAQ